MGPDGYKRSGSGASGRVWNKGSILSCCGKHREFTNDLKMVSDILVRP